MFSLKDLTLFLSGITNQFWVLVCAFKGAAENNFLQRIRRLTDKIVIFENMQHRLVITAKISQHFGHSSFLGNLHHLAKQDGRHTRSTFCFTHNESHFSQVFIVEVKITSYCMDFLFRPLAFGKTKRQVPSLVDIDQ